MKKLTLPVFLLFSVLSAVAGDKKFSVQEIPGALMKHAHVVVRTDQSELTVHNTRSYTLKRHYAVTILNEHGDDYADFAASYDKLHRVARIEGYLYDANGNLIQKLKAKDVRDVSGVGDDNLMDDTRIKTHNFLYHKFPYTVEYSYETTFSHTFFFPRWMPVMSENAAIQSSTFIAKYPLGYGFRYHTFNIDRKPDSLADANGTSLRWTITNMSPVKVPDNFAHWRNVVPVVAVAPSEFQLENISGNMSNWKDFGSFIFELIKGKDMLPERIRNKVHELTQELTDDGEKVRALYSFMQSTTRYISIQLGAGGWIPFDASYVADKGYGDCKALTNYMHSLLREAGVASYYTLIWAGSDPMDRNWVISDFPSNQFNHVILCVPNKGDTTWLECTSQILPAGYLSNMTSNRKALMVRAEGGHLVSTPRYGVQENLVERRTKATIADNGTARIQSETAFGATRQDFLHTLIRTRPPAKVKEYLSASISIPTFDIENFSYREVDSSIPVLHESLDITSHNYATVSGKRLFVTPNILGKKSAVYRVDPDRQADFQFEYEFSDRDVVEITLPKGYVLESAMKPVELRTEFGYYKANCELNDDKLIYHRSFEQYKAKLPASEQLQILSFFEKVYSADRSRIVLVKREE